MTELVSGLIGTPNNEVISEFIESEFTSFISQVVIYDTEYIVNAILLILFNIGIFILISNFQKSFSRGRK